MKAILLPLAVLGVLAASLPRASAQACPYDMAFTNYGTSCTASGLANPYLFGSYQSGPGGCSVTFTISFFPGCCNTFTVGRFLVIGAQQVSIPLGTGCDLLASPDLILALPSTGPGVASVAIPLPPDPALVGLSAYAQAVVHRFTTIGMTDDFDFSAGLQASFIP